MLTRSIRSGYGKYVRAHVRAGSSDHRRRNGIGAEVARELSGRGASVAVLDCDAAQAETLAGELGDGAMGLGADVTDPASLAEAMDAVVQRFGGIDVVVANAGIAGPIATVAHVSAERWQQVIDVNLVGVFHTVRLALPHVQPRRGYMMVVASAAAALPGPTFSAYMASKWGVEALARALRMELSDTGVGVGIAYFGLIDTQLGNSISATTGWAPLCPPFRMPSARPLPSASPRRPLPMASFGVSGACTHRAGSRCCSTCGRRFITSTVCSAETNGCGTRFAKRM